MKRAWVYAVLLVLLGLVVLVGGMSFSGGASSEEDPARITSYEADFRVDDSGDLHATETLTVDFPRFGNRHGIFRFFDHRDESDAFARRKPRDIEVTLDGDEEDFEILSEGDGRYTNVKIGSAYRTVSGPHVYVITYTVDDVLQDKGEQSRFYWNLVPAGWQMDIDRAELSVSLPGDVDEVACYQGAGETSGCTAEGQGTDRLTVKTGALDDHTPVTIDTIVDVEAPPAGSRSLWPTYLDGVLGQHLATLLLVLGLGAVAGFLGLRASRSTREKQPSFPLMYAPPEGVGPAQAAYVLNERVDNTMYVASLMHAAEQGVVSFGRDGSEWTVGPPSGERTGSVDEVTQGIVHKLGASRQTFTAAPSDVKAGETLREALGAFKGDVRSWASRTRVMELSGLGGLGGFVLVAAIIATVAVAFSNPLNATIWAIVPGLFVVFGYEIAAPGAGTRRTPEGRDLWSRIGGFHRILSTPSAEARFDFAARKDLYTTYLPWAVAFGCADEWAQKYRIEVGEEPPAPHYWSGQYGGVHTGAFVGQMVSSFDQTVDAAISSYEATQRSSSSGGSGGGGGFGGGGGGGGGGGSW